MTEYQSDSSEVSELIVQIQNTLLKTLKSSQNVISTQAIESIRNKIQQISNSQSAIETIQHFLFTLISTIERLKQSLFIDVEKQDYENLEGAVQKAEAEIRKHIRLQQQLKIYMDGLEEKVQQLQTQLKIQSHKYLQLFQSIKAVDAQKKQLKKKIKEYQIKIKCSQQKDSRVLSHKTSKILSEPSVYQNVQTNSHNPYKLYNQRARITKSKQFADKSLNFKQQPVSSDKNKKLLESDIRVSLGHSPAIKKRAEVQRNSQIRQMTRTIQLKQNFRKQSRKLLKYSTQQRNILPNKKNADNRSNSVCH